MSHDDRLPEVVSREAWREARVRLLEKEKAATRARDELNRERRELPMVLVDKDYVFEGPSGPVTLLDLFDGQRQLVVVHFMFEPSWDEGCKGCTGAADEVSDGLLRHLRHRDTALVHVSRAPLAKLDTYKAKRGWTFPWVSSFGSDFNYDYGVTLDEGVRPIEYNYRGKEELLARGDTDFIPEPGGSKEAPGYSFFLRIGDQVFHTYSTFGRGTEAVGGSYGFLDLSALGRQEDWEEPKGRVAAAKASLPFFE